MLRNKIPKNVKFVMMFFSQIIRKAQHIRSKKLLSFSILIIYQVNHIGLFTISTME